MTGARRAVALVAVVVAACGGEGPSRSGDASLDARVRVSPTPAVVGESRVLVQATEHGRPLADASVRLRAEAVDTAGGGFAAPEVALAPGQFHPVPVAEGGGGDYGAVVLHFPAPGRWRLVVELRTDDGRTATFRHPLTVVGPPGG